MRPESWQFSPRLYTFLAQRLGPVGHHIFLDALQASSMSSHLSRSSCEACMIPITHAHCVVLAQKFDRLMTNCLPSCAPCCPWRCPPVSKNGLRISLAQKQGQASNLQGRRLFASLARIVLNGTGIVCRNQRANNCPDKHIRSRRPVKTACCCKGVLIY